MVYECIEVTYSDTFATLTLNNPKRRNALSLKCMQEVTAALREIGDSSARGVILAANGPAFSAGHDFADMAGADLDFMRKLLKTCTIMMDTIQEIPQPVLARVHAIATAAGCQLVATCDLAVASTEASFATPGGKGGWFCTTPMVALSRNIGRKRALEMLLTGDPIDAQTAYEWGLVNRVVPPEKLEEESLRLLGAATRGSFFSKEMGKQAYYAQIEMPQPLAYSYAIEVMAAASQTPDAQEGMQAFLEKRKPRFQERS
ncbi:enoyl-CoA hydratase/carnithine racemase [Thermosporothrix hazakensis]|jgi:enoyl-CoA hydratase/carnithine racemase|uniref:Enoyl-CoA hydratase domain-containing protein 3, mitochondrial n=2 Tax=Thermosporothrix TaxID=768650 RepID=A0A326U2F6_THEHA|nr:enoyl-CoA hydratase [Thermosporothrix hazakensis]PZW25449.1 enoyl-CoA hydratase/carnithine racemase [Thermosporothrix hazakensis]BBH90785.1 enoyl-CoA hydratase [Thermosporothrix sp. COM3]GCE48835.1 enoyl-CoA hydratase [Thermosporothrix hazakensis]